MINIVNLLMYYIIEDRTVINKIHTYFNISFYGFLYLSMSLTVLYILLTLIVVLFRKNEKEKEFDPENAPFVTIQIPTRNEVVALRCAKRCLDFDYPKHKFEILIGDDSDDKSVSDKIDEFAAQHTNVQVIRRKENIGFKPGNLNNMLKYSKGEILVLFDSDFTPETDFLKRIITPFIHDKEVATVQAKWNFNNFDQNMVTILASTIVYIFHHVILNFMHIFGTGSLCGSAEAIKKKDLIELGGWTSGSLTEDVEYSLRLHKSNKKMVYLPNLECYNDVPYIPMDLYKQQMRWAYGVITSYKMHFKGIFFNKNLPLKRKMISLCAGFGYSMPILIVVLFVFGTVSFLTDVPGPINVATFSLDLGRNVLLTSGLIIVSLFSLYREKKIKYWFKTLLSSFSFGLVTTYYVNKGIFKSIFGKPMKWYLLNKTTEV